MTGRMEQIAPWGRSVQKTDKSIFGYFQLSMVIGMNEIKSEVWDEGIYYELED